jgi:O-acetyl-ADP-ribose deacetylase (regulator of RNase III)
VYGYPSEDAARIAVSTIGSILAASPSMTDVIFCCFSARDLTIYERLLADPASA